MTDLNDGVPELAPSSETPPAEQSAPAADGVVNRRAQLLANLVANRAAREASNEAKPERPPAGKRTEALRRHVRDQNARRAAADPVVVENKTAGGGGSGNAPKLPLVGKLTSMLGGVAKMSKKTWLIIGVIVLLIAVGVAALFVWPMIFGGGEVSTPPVISAPVFEPSPGPTVVQPTAPRSSGWDLSFVVPANRLEWKSGWWLTWAILIVLNLFFRAEAIRRGDPWDWANVTVMLLASIVVMTAAKGAMVVIADQCLYWLVSACPMGQLSLSMIDTGAMILWVVVWLVVFFSSLAAAYTGRLDYSPWAIGTFSVSLLAKLLLAHPAAQLLATFGMVVGLAIYVAEIGGLRWPTTGKVTPGGWFAFGFGLLIMVAVTPILAAAFGYLAGGVSQLPWLAVVLYQGRLLWGLFAAWGLATVFTYMLTPSLAPQLERLGTGSVVVGDAEKVDTATMLLMVMAFVFAIGWMPIIAGWL